MFIRKALAALSDDQSKRALVVTYMREVVANVLHVPSERIVSSQPLQALGLDSLQTVELQHSIETMLGRAVPLTTLLNGATLDTLADMILAAPAAEPLLPQFEASSPVAAPASYGQRALWFVQQLALEAAAYNIYTAVQILSPLDPSSLAQALQRLIERHPTLRSCLPQDQGQPFQHIAAEAMVDYQFLDLRHLTPATIDAQLAAEAHQPFDLTTGPLFRARLYLRPDASHLLLLVMHHTVADFWSLAIIAYELGMLYTAALRQSSAALPNPAAQYTDFVRYQEQLLASTRAQELWQYWQQQLQPPLATLDMPLDHPRPGRQTFRGAVQTFSIAEPVVQQLRQLGQAQGATLYMVLLAAFQALLARYSGQSDIIIGSPAVGRERAEFAQVVGYFINPLVLRTQLHSTDSFTTLLARVRQSVLDGLAHQAYPFALLVERLKTKWDPSRSPLFQIMFLYQKAPALGGIDFTPFALELPEAQATIGDLTVRAYPLSAQSAQFDLTLAMAEWQGRLYGRLHYNSDLFQAAAIAQMVEHFCTLLQSAATHPEQPLAQLELFPPQLRDQLLYAWNATAQPLAAADTIPALFAAQVAHTPNATALIFEDQALTFAELEARSNQLAQYLCACGVGPEVLVGVYLQRSLELVMTLLAVLKAGGAYVPLDPAYPPERIAYILADSTAPVLITQAALRDGLRSYTGHIVCLEDVVLASYPSTPPATQCSGHNLAYVIYTSGSTGRPRGVMIEQRSVVNFFQGMDDRVGCDAHDTLLAITSISFDVSVLELFWTLTRGVRVILLSDQSAQAATVGSPGTGLRAQQFSLLAQAQRYRPTLFQCTPSHMRLLFNDPAAFPTLQCLQKLLSCGEALPPDLAQIIKEQLPARLINLYGPTETTVFSAVYEPGPIYTPLPIGSPIANTQCYILDQHMQPVPIGVVGELYIGGAGLARGYYRLPAVSAARFVPNPFAQPAAEQADSGLPSASASRLYRTGDLARYMPDGNIQYLGRSDFQVKIRGYRIEIGEIEVVLSQHPAIKEAVVIAREDLPNDKRLVAYVVAQPDASVPSSKALREFLATQLPPYMLPAVVVPLSAFPLTPNGKIDRKNLPAPTQQPIASSYVAPSGKVEQQISAIWQQVLGLEQISVYDNFFDLGGHSLLMAQLQAQLSAQFQQPIALTTLFEHPTIRDMARFIVAGNTQSNATAEQARQRAQQQQMARRRRSGRE